MFAHTDTERHTKQEVLDGIGQTTMLLWRVRMHYSVKLSKMK